MAIEVFTLEVDGLALEDGMDEVVVALGERGEFADGDFHYYSKKTVMKSDSIGKIELFKL